MAKKDFKPIYRTVYSAQGTLANEVIPNHVDDLLKSIELTESGNQEGIILLFSMISSLSPPFRKTFRNYDKLKDRIEKCRTLKNEWLRVNKRREWPTELVENLLELYEEWWEAFNESGAGLGLQSVDPRRDVKIRRIITGEKT